MNEEINKSIAGKCRVRLFDNVYEQSALGHGGKSRRVEYMYNVTNSKKLNILSLNFMISHDNICNILNIYFKPIRNCLEIICTVLC